ncbi:tetratricopeptide repeat protein, partial [Actinomadura fibrosa]
MDVDRVVDVWADGAYGSGHLVAPRLVLTALHVVAEDVPPFGEPFTGAGAHRDGARVRVLGEERWWECRVRWPLPGEARWDAALLEITDPEWPVPPGSVRWGRFTTAAPDAPCELVGFPRGQRTAGGVRETEHVTGRISPVTGSKTGHLQIEVAAKPDGSPGAWAGMSGAAVLCNRLVTAVVIEDARDHHRLIALPVRTLFADDAFRAAVREPDPESVELESVELAPLLAAPPDAGPPARAEVSYVSLLRADMEAVRFRGREDELARLLVWCENGDFAMRLLTGPGGQGKTRLARELLARLRARGWAGGIVDAESGTTEALAPLRAPTAPTLLVLDYAETRPEQIKDVVRALGGHRGPVPLRVLLIARSAGDWWDELALQSGRVTRTAIRGTPVDVLTPLEESRPGRADAFAEAVTDLAAALAQAKRGWRPPPLDPLPARDFTPQRYGLALALQMEALAYLLVPGGGRGERSAADIILEHEEPYWANAAASRGLALHARTQRRVVAAASLCGARTEAQAVALLARVPGLADWDEDARLHVATWFRDLYPADEGSAFWGALEPDRLAEHLVSVVLRDDEDLLPRLLRDAAPDQVRQALIVLARAGLHDPAGAARIERLLVAVPELAFPTVQTAPQSEHPRPLVDAVRHLVDTTAPDERGLALFAGLSDALPRQTRLFSSVAVTIAQILAGVRRTLAEADPGGYLPDLAQSLNTLANRLAGAGRFEEALAPAREATTIRRRLADGASTAADPTGDGTAAHRPALAESLVTLAARLTDVDRCEEARRVAEEAVGLYRELAADDPGLHRPDLAESLDTLAVALARAGRREEALERARQAVAIRQELSHTNPNAYLPDLARSLNTMTTQLTALGQGAEARDTAERAASLLRALADRDSDAHLADLAVSLDGLTRTLVLLRKADEALHPARETVVLRRRLAEGNPGAFAPGLARSLLVLADLLAVTGWPRGAQRLAAEAVRRWRELAGPD